MLKHCISVEPYYKQRTQDFIRPYFVPIGAGYNTGSVYNDLVLANGGFPGEYVTDGSVIVVKTHLQGAEHRTANAFTRAILVIRAVSLNI